MSVSFAALAASIFMWPATAVTASDPPGRITRIGGIFVVSTNPRALAAWYRDVLGISLEPWGGATFRYDTTGHPPVAVWSRRMIQRKIRLNPHYANHALHFLKES